MIRTIAAVLLAAASLALAGCGTPSSRTEESKAPAAQAAPATSSEAATALIDAEMSVAWKRAGVTPAPDASDAEFQRRVTLDLVGRIPTSDEVTAFLADRSQGKRAALVDRLLASEDYAIHWAAVYTDLLIGRSVRFKVRFAELFTGWLERALAEGRPLDRMAREMVSARGRLTDNGAVAYIASYKMRDGSLETLAGNTARVFLGLQIQCAQCHDHPTDKRWKQRDFGAFAAFFAEIRVPRTSRKAPETTFTDDLDLGFAATPNARREIKRVAPGFLHRPITRQGNESRRDALARVITTSPLFARAAVGFTWDRLFGRGLVEPWDDLGHEDDPRQPPLLKQLAAGFARGGHDHRWLLRAIVLSKAYGRSSTGGAAPKGAAPDIMHATFARAAVRPLTADQLLRSQLLVTGVERSSAAAMRRWQTDRIHKRVLREYLTTFDDDEGGDVDSFTGSIPQALLLRNGDLTNSGTLAAPGAVLGGILDAAAEPSRRLDAMFVAAYARLPEAGERRTFLEHLRSRGDSARAYEDIFHALVTSTEFVTNH